jgi:hypothetical protein
MIPKDTQITSNIIHPDLILAQKYLYTPCNLPCTSVTAEAESADYGAYTFQMNKLNVQYRVAKITPTKTGQFVTLWKRSKEGPIQPFHISDPVDLFIVNTKNTDHFGQFIFPKSVLYERGVLSDNLKEGKRAFRVYPPWDHPTNNQARKTQQWQLKYFIEARGNQPTDLQLAKSLLQQDQN